MQYPFDDQGAAMHGQASITVGHESLRVAWALDKPHPTRGLSRVQPPTACQASRPVTNVLAEYS